MQLLRRAARTFGPEEAAADPALNDPATTFLPVPRLEALLATRSEEAIAEAVGADPWLHNYYRSIWEKANRRITLATYPWHQAYAIADVCNARCPFCSNAYETSGIFDVARIERFAKIIRFARTLILTGGEATVHPKFREILRAIQPVIDRRCFFSLITNGARLERFLPDLLATPVSFAVSLNAATPATHHDVMRLGPQAFDRIVSVVRDLRAQGRYVALSMVVTRRNLAEVPAFIDLANDLDASAIYVRTMNPLTERSRKTTPAGFRVLSGYPDLHPTTHPEFERLRAEAAASILRSAIPVSCAPDQWSVPTVPADAASKAVVLPAKRLEECTTAGTLIRPEELDFVDPADPYRRSAPYPCDHVYYALQMLDQSNTYAACCFMRRVPGYDPVGLFAKDDFLQLRNSPAFVELRRRLQEGPLLPSCLTCTYQLGY